MHTQLRSPPCILSCPATHCRQTYFYQAVILLLDHGPDGSYGIILNRPTQYKVSQIKSTVHELLSLFKDNRLYMGGDCGDTAMVVLTHRSDIEGVTKVGSHGVGKGG